MADILVVCTGNICRSPIAEGLIRSLLRARFGETAPSVASAGTGGWVGSGADPSSVAAAAEIGIEISAHRARQLELDDVADATVVLGMAREHRDAAVHIVPGLGWKIFTLKDLVRLLEALPEAPGRGEPRDVLRERVREAGVLGSRRDRNRMREDDVPDPLGMPPEYFRAVARELEDRCTRLVDGLFGHAPARTSASDRTG